MNDIDISAKEIKFGISWPSLIKWGWIIARGIGALIIGTHIWWTRIDSAQQNKHIGDNSAEIHQLKKILEDCKK